VRVLRAEAVRRNDLGLDPSKPTILLASDSPCKHTGLGRSTRMIWSPIYETGKFNIVQLAWWHVNVKEEVPWTLLATKRNAQGIIDPADKYGNVSLNHVLSEVQPSIVWTSGDPWMVLPMTQRRNLVSGPIIFYSQCDGGPLDITQRNGNTLGWEEAVRGADVVVPCAPWGHDLLKDSFPNCSLRPYIPFGVDTSVFKPVDVAERQKIKASVFKLDPRARVFMSVSRNQQRKYLAANMQALYFLRRGRFNICAECGAYNVWRRDYSRRKDLGPEPFCKFCGHKKLRPGRPQTDLFYYMHAPLDDAMDDSYRLIPLLRQFGLIDSSTNMNAVFWNNELRSTSGEMDDKLSTYYAGTDAFALPTTGEGFCLPMLESMACGTPVVAPAHSSHPFFVSGVGRLVPISYYWCEPPTNYWRGLVSVDAWAQNIDEATKSTEETRQACRQRALSFDWKHIWPKWLKLIEESLRDGKSANIWQEPIKGV